MLLHFNITHFSINIWGLLPSLVTQTCRLNKLSTFPLPPLWGGRHIGLPLSVNLSLLPSVAKNVNVSMNTCQHVNFCTFGILMSYNSMPGSHLGDIGQICIQHKCFGHPCPQYTFLTDFKILVKKFQKKGYFINHWDSNMQLYTIYIYVSPMKWGDILFLAPLSVCPSVRPSICPSVTITCPLYIFWTPGGIFK